MQFIDHQWLGGSPVASSILHRQFIELEMPIARFENGSRLHKQFIDRRTVIAPKIESSILHMQFTGIKNCFVLAFFVFDIA